VESSTAIQNCTYYASQDPFAIHEGNGGLKSVTAKSYGFGGVWSPTSDFDVKVDYYNVRINNEVQIQSIDQLLKDESACRLGQLDINSPTCVAALSQVQRSAAVNGPNAYALQQLTVLPVNIANERVSGILASLHYRYDLGRWGAISLASQYNVTLKHSFQQYPFDPTHDLLRNPFYSTEFKTIGNASISWDWEKFSVTAYGTRFGKTGNYQSQLGTDGYAAPCSTVSGYTSCPGKVAPWMLYNGSVSYNITDNMKISGIVNNIKNSMPPKDPTYTAVPFYNSLNYNPYGRSYWVEFDWRFGKSSD
jgi:outer membrane receptor protein involved in Fe transport